MPETFLTVDRDNWYVVSIASQQGRVAFNIYLLKRIFSSTLSILDNLFSFFAKMTAGPAVNDHMGFRSTRLHKLNISSEPGRSQIIAINSRIEGKPVKKPMGAGRNPGSK